MRNDGLNPLSESRGQMDDVYESPKPPPGVRVPYCRVGESPLFCGKYVVSRHGGAASQNYIPFGGSSHQRGFQGGESASACACCSPLIVFSLGIQNPVSASSRRPLCSVRLCRRTVARFRAPPFPTKSGFGRGEKKRVLYPKENVWGNFRIFPQAPLPAGECRTAARECYYCSVANT